MELELSNEVLDRRKWKRELYENLLKNSILAMLYTYLNGVELAIDVGGNTGYQSYYYSFFCKRVVTYEPVPGLFDILKENLNMWKDKITFINKAVGEYVGDIDLYVDVKRLSNTSRVPLVESEKITVPMTTLDREKHEKVGFIKVDVEGFEYNVLQGAEKTIDKQRPICMVEIYKPFSRHPLNTIFDWFFNKNYECYYYNKSLMCLVKVEDTENGVDAVEHNHDLHDGDFLFIPAEMQWPTIQ